MQAHARGSGQRGCDRAGPAARGQESSPQCRTPAGKELARGWWGGVGRGEPVTEPGRERMEICPQQRGPRRLTWSFVVLRAETPDRTPATRCPHSQQGGPTSGSPAHLALQPAPRPREGRQGCRAASQRGCFLCPNPLLPAPIHPRQPSCTPGLGIQLDKPAGDGWHRAQTEEAESGSHGCSDVTGVTAVTGEIGRGSGGRELRVCLGSCM